VKKFSMAIDESTNRWYPNVVLSLPCLIWFVSFQVPAVMTDRYARLNHGYSDERDCADYAMGEKPQECLDGSADAQYAVAIEAMISNGFTFLTSSLIGSLSDEYGRKGILVFGVALSTLSPL
jgi:MFS family permease